MKKKIPLAILLIFSLTCSAFSINRSLSTYIFNADKVKDNITYLSSDAFKGRMAGTLGNTMAATYVRAQFQKNNLEAYVNDYYEKFNVVYPEKISGSPHLRVLNNQGQCIKEFAYGIDFKEDMLSFTQNHVVYNKSSKITNDDRFIRITSGTYNYIFYAPDDNKLLFRSSFDANNKISLLIAVTTPTLKQMKTYVTSGNNIDCFVPYKESKTTINNVLAYIKGSNPKLPPVVISAHFDHMGMDFSNNIYHGALDNASGISFVLEFSKYLKSLGTPSRDIIFAGFNAEEYGLLGSEAFANQYSNKLKGGEVFNYDMIGSDNSVPLGLMGAKKDNRNTPLIHTVSVICSNDHINYNYIFEDSSDHSSFRKLGIDALTFCDSDMTRIHTPEDKAEYINTSAIKRCFNVSSEEVIKLSYNYSPLILYNTQILIVSLVLSLIFAITLIFFFVKDRALKRK